MHLQGVRRGGIVWRERGQAGGSRCAFIVDRCSALGADNSAPMTKTHEPRSFLVGFWSFEMIGAICESPFLCILDRCCRLVIAAADSIVRLLMSHFVILDD